MPSRMNPTMKAQSIKEQAWNHYLF
jgi:hypothetical protein